MKTKQYKQTTFQHTSTRITTIILKVRGGWWQQWKLVRVVPSRTYVSHRDVLFSAGEVPNTLILSGKD